MKVPTELRILRAGRNGSMYGPIVFDETAARTVMEAYISHGVARLPFDWGHAMMRDSSAPAAGWYTLGVVDGELWALDIEWTETALTRIKSNEIKYLSPTLIETGGHVTRLVNVALTNLPAIDGMEQIMKFSIVPFKTGSISESPWDGSAAEARLAEAAGGDMAKYALGFAWFDESAADLAGSYKLPHHDIEGGELVVSRAGVLAAAAVLQGARGGADIPEEDIAAIEEHLAGHYTDMEMIPPWVEQTDELDAIVKAAGVPADQVVLKLSDMSAAIVRLGAENERLSLIVEHSEKFSPTALRGWAKRADLETLRTYVMQTKSVRCHSQPIATKIQASQEEQAVARMFNLSDDEIVTGRSK